MIGEGHNFVATMQRLAREGVSPSVVDDQWGRPAFATDLARAVRHLVTRRRRTAPTTCPAPVSPPPGRAWRVRSSPPAAGTPRTSRRVTTEEYAGGKSLAPRPRHGTLDLRRLEATGFETTPWKVALVEHLGRSADLAQ